MLIFNEEDYNILLDCGMSSNKKPYSDKTYNTSKGKIRIRGFLLSDEIEKKYINTKWEKKVIINL
jgi:CDGSH-type Zn-finger protein